MAWFITQISYFIEAVNEATKGWKGFRSVLISKMQCLKCLTFWATLAVTLNFPLACMVSLLATIIDDNLLTTENTRL